jgi:DNA replication protein DnaC
MCVPVRFTGGNFRKITAQEKMERVKKMMEEGKANDREE